MSSLPLSRRRVLQVAGAGAIVSATGIAITSSAAAAVVPPARPDIGVSAYPFDLGQVRLTAGRWLDNQNRTLTYLRFVDVDRLLYNFRANHRLSTNGAAANGGWDAPNFPFRTHMPGPLPHRLGAGVRGARRHHLPRQGQLHGGRAGQVPGQQRRGRVQHRLPVRLPRVRLHRAGGRTRPTAVPYYCIHKTLAGLLDVWRYIGNTQARDVLLALRRLGRLAHRPADLQPDADRAAAPSSAA